MSQYSPSFGTSPLPSPPPAPIAESELDISTYAAQSSTERPIEEEVLEVLEGAQNGHDIHRAEPCKSSPSIPVRPFSGSFSPSCCCKRKCSKCNIWLTVLCSSFFLLSIALFLVWAITSDGFSNLRGVSNVCSSRDCINTAFRFTNSIDDSVNPCDNFYRYSCGKFHRQDLEKQKNFVEIQTEATRYALYDILSAADTNDTSRTAIMARNLFASCMNTSQRTNVGYAPLVDTLKNLPCGPILTGCNFNATSYRWERHSGVLGWYAAQFNLVVFATDVHPQDRSEKTLQFRAPNLSRILEPVREDLIRLANPGPTEMDTLLQVQLRQNLTKSALLKTIEPDEKKRQDMLDEVAQLIVEVSQIATTTPSNITEMTFGELTKTVLKISWNDLLYAELSASIKLTDTSVISVMNLNYFEQLARILSKYSSQTLANYLVVVTAKHLEQFIYDESIQPSWRKCVENMESFEPVQKLYIMNNQNRDYDKIKSFLAELKRLFIRSHRTILLRHLGEINRIAFLVGYPKRLADEDLVWRPFATVTTDPSDYFSSITRLLKQQSIYRLSQIGTYLDTDDTTFYEVLRPTIQYNAHLAIMVIPITFLQTPISFPNEGAPMYSVYGSLGAAVNHFMAKIFLPQMDVTDQMQCLDPIYRGFLANLYRNSPDIQDELLQVIEFADALRTTLYGYIAWTKGSSTQKEQKLPGFDTFDDEKNMIMAFSTLFCNREGALPGSPYEAIRNRMLT